MFRVREDRRTEKENVHLSGAYQEASCTHHRPTFKTEQRVVKLRLCSARAYLLGYIFASSMPS